MKYTKFGDIPQFARDGNYQCDVNISRVPRWIKDMEEDMNLQLNPDFQRGHVWTEEQQIAWLEFFLKGGKSGLYTLIVHRGIGQFQMEHTMSLYVLMDCRD